MRAPDFWWLTRPNLVARLLQPLGALYGAVTLRRMRKPGATVGVPVICVGNFTAGGAGKTPTALALAARLAARGETPFVLMRGYGGRLAGPVGVDVAAHGTTDVGDEAVLMAGHVPTIVSRDRPAGAAFAQGLGASVIVMDDGLQNPSLAKTLALAVVDGGGGIGNGLCLPAGPLRAPLSGQWRHTDAVILIGSGEAGARLEALARRAGKPVLKASLQPDAASLAALTGTSVLMLCGIGRPEKFRETLRQAGARIIAERIFGDHHAYRAADVLEVLTEAVRLGCVVATTQKDMTKLAALWPPAERDRLLVVTVSLVFEDEDALEALLSSALVRPGPPAAA